ncbi:MAG: IS630 family transposase [Rhodospirillales bacterium]|nr:IS630 family transposase [Rhodospirillales bacterium]
MIRPGFLPAKERRALVKVARNGLCEHRVARRANAIVLLNDGWSCEAVAKALLVDDDTVRGWYRSYESGGLEELERFGHEGSSCRLTEEEQADLTSWVTATLPCDSKSIGAWIEERFGLSYSHAGLIALLHRLGLEYRKPKAVSSKLDEAEQQDFIKDYNALLNGLGDDEAVMFADAVHPTHGARPVGCWAPKETKVAVDQTSGRQRLNIHGAIDLETGKTRMLDVLTVNAMSTIALLMAIEAQYPTMRLIHVFVDNARYHNAKIVREWLAEEGRRIKLHFVPSYCPHLNPIERLWGLMHKTLTHNRCYATFDEFRDAMLGFLKEEVPRNWSTLCDNVSDNFRVISPKDFRIVA